MSNKDWLYRKNVRELLQEIHMYEVHAAREIENNKVCDPSKIRDNAQRYLQVCIDKYEKYTGEKYVKND